jgi:peptidoglycan/xylan/chitin deacetylase (PgdA/CDA1 family)
VPDRSIVITFDDGYADNLHTARPLLERYDTPATVFLITDRGKAEQYFWWDKLGWALLEPETLPGRLEMGIAGGHCAWTLGDAVCYPPEIREGDRKLMPWEAAPGTRLAFFYSVWQHLVPLEKHERWEAVDAICAWARMDAGRSRESRVLTPDELSALSRSNLVELGAHTVNHPSLPALSSEKQLEEIRGSKLQIEEITGSRVTSFSYPHGDFTEETAALVQQAGFTCACTTKFECVRTGEDLFQLPRFQVENWDGEEFLRRLYRWYQAVD